MARNYVPPARSPTAWASDRTLAFDTHLKGEVGTDILSIPSLPGPVGTKAMCTLQALPKEIQVEENIVLPSQASFQSQKHQGSEGIWGAADVDNWGERGRGQREKLRSWGRREKPRSSGREAGAPRGTFGDPAVVEWNS